MSDAQLPGRPRASHDTLVANNQTDLGSKHTSPQPSPDSRMTATQSGGSHEEQDIEKGDMPTYASGESGPSTSQKQEDAPSDPNLVGWSGPDDPENPQNWGLVKKCGVTATLSLLTLVITFSSSVFSTSTEDVEKVFHVGSEVSTLGTSLFVLGFCFGPLMWGPFSELYGRLIPLYVGFGCFAIFQIPVAVAQNIETIMLCRFFGGFFGSAPLAIVGGAFADYWDAVDRGIAIAMFVVGTFLGPILGPIIGGFVTESYLGWRWTQWITLFMAAGMLAIALPFVPEMYAPVILQRKAARQRFETKNWALHSPLDEHPVSMYTIATVYLSRPFIMLVEEPILLSITLYLALM